MLSSRGLGRAERSSAALGCLRCASKAKPYIRLRLRLGRQAPSPRRVWPAPGPIPSRDEDARGPRCDCSARRALDCAGRCPGNMASVARRGHAAAQRGKARQATTGWRGARSPHLAYLITPRVFEYYLNTYLNTYLKTSLIWGKPMFDLFGRKKNYILFNSTIRS